MSLEPLLLGIDLGTSGVKVGLFGRDGRLVGLGRSRGYRFRSPAPGWAECDASEWWPAIVTAARAAVAAAGDAGVSAAVTGIGISSFFPTLVPLDGDGRPLRPGILYSDQRAIEQARAILKIIPRRRYERITGNRLAVGNTVVTGIHWLRDCERACYDTARVFAFANTVVVRRLTGEIATDWTTASLSGLVDIRDPSRWDSGLCAALGVPVEKLPRILGPAAPAGALDSAAAAELGLPPGIPVVCGAGDTVASALGAGVLEPGGLLYSAGSTDCITVVLDRPGADHDWIGVGHVPRGRWVSIGANASGGLSLDWFAREVIGGGSDVEEALRAAADAPAGRLVFLPYLQGERTPVWDPLARGLFLGLSAGTTRGEMTRAVIEGAAFSVRHMLETLEATTRSRVASLPSVGGGTRSAVVNRIRADVLQRPLEVLRFQETAALGAALVAGVGAGVYGSEAAAVEAAVGAQAVDRVEPDPSRAGVYDRLYRAYREAYARTRGLMHDLAG
jgi:xylulokinase